MRRVFRHPGVLLGGFLVAAMTLAGGEYAIHGTNEPRSIGRAVSSGCIRLTNDDIVHLYDRVKVGAKVVVLR